MKKSRPKPPKAGSSPSGNRRPEGKEIRIDMRGLKCPFPALKAKKRLSEMASDEVLVIECTDPLTTIDIPNLVRETGDTLAGSSKKGRVLTFRIKKK